MKPQTTPEDLPNQPLAFFKEGNEAKLYLIGDTLYLIRMPKSYLDTKAFVLQMDSSHLVHIRLSQNNFNFIPAIKSLTNEQKLKLINNSPLLRPTMKRLLDCTSSCTNQKLAESRLYSSILIIKKFEGQTLREQMDSSGSEPKTQQSTEPAYGNWQETLSFFRQLAQNVLALHRVGIIHGDLSPDNIVGTEAYLIDFNRSQLVNWRGHVRAWVATQFFSPPECLNDNPNHFTNGYAIDYWALGVIFYYLVTGSSLVFGDTTRQLPRSDYNNFLQTQPEINFAHSIFTTTGGAYARGLISTLLNFNRAQRVNFNLLEHPCLKRHNLENLNLASTRGSVLFALKNSPQSSIAKKPLGPISLLQSITNQPASVKAFSLVLIFVGTSLILTTGLTSIPTLKIALMGSSMLLGYALGTSLSIFATTLFVSSSLNTFFTQKNQTKLLERQPQLPTRQLDLSK